MLIEINEGLSLNDWAVVLTNMQTPFYAQIPTLMSTLENNKLEMVGELINSVMG